jgi:hypothetical protein
MRPLEIATSKKLFVDVDVRQHIVIVNPHTLSPSTFPDIEIATQKRTLATLRTRKHHNTREERREGTKEIEFNKMDRGRDRRLVLFCVTFFLHILDIGEECFAELL